MFVGYFAQPVFPLVRLLYRGPIIADAYFSMYDTMIHDKQMARPGSLLARICYWLDRHMLRRAQLCLTDTNQHVEYMCKAFDAPKPSVTLQAALAPAPLAPAESAHAASVHR